MGKYKRIKQKQSKKLSIYQSIETNESLKSKERRKTSLFQWIFLSIFEHKVYGLKYLTSVERFLQEEVKCQIKLVMFDGKKIVGREAPGTVHQVELLLYIDER